MPESILDEVLALVEWSEHDFDRIEDVVRANPPTATVGQFALAIAEQTELDFEKVVGLLDLIIVFHYSMDTSQTSLEEVLEDVETSFGSGEKYKDRSPDDIAGAMERLRRVLDTRLTFGLTEKAQQLASADERSFRNAQIVTDLRPVFTEDATQEPSLVVLTNLFRISYMEDGRSREFLVSLDTEDVATLTRILGRAQQKITTLKSMFKAGPMRILDAADE